MFILEKGVSIFNVNINIFVVLKVNCLQILHVPSGCPQLKTTFKKEQFAFLNRSHYNIEAFDDAGRRS